MKKLIIALAMPALIIGCSKKEKPKSPGGEGTPSQFLTQENNTISIKSIDDQPIPNAQILIGNSLNNPFYGNFLLTDSSGQVQIPAEWTTAMAITVQAPGFIRMTYMAQEPGALTIKLRPQPEKISYEVRGGVTGLPIQDKDGYVDFGLIMPAFTKLDILSFNINNIISPQNDRITALGQNVDIPANVSLPEQREKYSLLTVTLDKPIYRTYYGQPGINRVYAARGRFPFKATVDALRNGTQFYELINTIKLSGGAIRDLDIKQGENRLNLPAHELNFTDTKTVALPILNGDETFLAVGVAKQSGYLIPTDVKKANSNKKLGINISTLPNSEQFFLGVLKKSAEMRGGQDRMSVTLVPFEAGLTPNMLPLIPDPTLAADEIIMPRIDSVDGVNPLATYAVLSMEEEIQQGPAKVKLLNPRWEIYAQNWAESLKLPQWPNDGELVGKKRWEVNFVGSQTASQVPVGPAMIESATHVTHSSVSF